MPATLERPAVNSGNGRSGTRTLEPTSQRNRFSMPPGKSPTSNRTHGLWDVPAPPPVIEVQQLEKGQVDTFFTDKGYGFMETAAGRLFFHASGFRVPRMAPGINRGRPSQEIQLAQVRPKPKETDSDEAKQAATGHIPVPAIQEGMELMFVAGIRNGKKQALTWCLQGMYEELFNQLQNNYREEYANWQKLGRYKLELCERRQCGGSMRADNALKTFVPQTKVVHTPLFEGTNTDYLKSWFQSCRATYNLSPANHPNPVRWIELRYQVYDEATQQLGEWQLCDTETMNDFLG